MSDANISETTSPLIEMSPVVKADDVKDLKKNEVEKLGGGFGENSWYTYALAGIVIVLVLYMFYYSYSCFCENQELSENFIEKTVKTGIDSDRSFDVSSEVKKLSQLQEQYLQQINSKRNF